MIAWLVHITQPISGTLIANARGYWGRCGRLFVVVAVAAYADMLSTIWFMHIDGIEHELHPIIRFVAGAFGPLAGPVIGKVGQLAGILLLTLYLRRLAVYIFVATTIMYSWAAWYNLFGRDLYTPLLFKLLQP